MRERIVKPRLGLTHIESLDVTKAISLKTALIRGGSLKRTRYGRKRVVRIASDQANRTNHQHQNHGQHDRILGDVLAPVVPQLAQKMTHIRTPSRANSTRMSIQSDEFDGSARSNSRKQAITRFDRWSISAILIFRRLCERRGRALRVERHVPGSATAADS